MKLARQGRQGFNGPSHLIAACVRAMRWILVDRARRRNSQRRGGQLIRVEMDEQKLVALEKDERLLELDEALERLARYNPVQAKVVDLHHFGGLSLPQTARVLGVSEPTAKRYWSYARAWLGRELNRRGAGTPVDS